MKPILIKPAFILLIILFANPKCFSQDRIILSSGDTIKCSITKVTRKHVFYSQSYNGVSTKGKIIKANIRELSYITAQQQEPKQELLLPGWPDNDPEFKTETGTNNLNRERIRLSVNGGPAYLLGNAEEAEEALQAQGVTVNDSKNYYNNLKLGTQVKSSVYVHAFGDYWVGALYHGFYSTSEITTALQMDDVYMYYGKLGERYFVNFTGASLFSVTRYGKLKRFGVNSSFTIGPAFYRNEAEMLNDQILIKGTSVATNLTLGIEYFIQPQISLSLESALFSSRLKKITVNNGQESEEIQLDNENYENLGRLDLSFGFIFYW